MKKKIVIGILIIIGLLLVKYGSFGKDKAPIYSGMVETKNTVVKSQVSGEIEKILVSEGEKINIGDLVYEINDVDFKIERERAIEKINISQNKINDLEEGYSLEEIDQIKSKMSQNNSKVLSLNEEWKKVSDRYSQLLELKKAGAVSENDLADAKVNLDKINYEISGLKYIDEELNFKLRDMENGMDKNQIETARAELNIANLNLDSANLNLDKCHKKSSVTGIVENVYFEEGEYVQPGNPILNVIDLENLWIEIYVEEKNLAFLNLEKPVEIYVSSLDKSIEGKISYISRTGEFTPKNIESRESKEEIVYKVKIIPNDTEKILRPGMFVDLVISK